MPRDTAVISVSPLRGARPNAAAANAALHVARLRPCWGCCRVYRSCTSMFDAEIQEGDMNAKSYRPSIPSCLLAMVYSVIYGLLGCTCRNKELKSYSTTVTPTEIVTKRLFYKCGLCCPVESERRLELDDVHEVVVDDCCGCFTTLYIESKTSHFQPRGDEDDDGVSYCESPAAVRMMHALRPFPARAAASGADRSSPTPAGAAPAQGTRSTASRMRRRSRRPSSRRATTCRSRARASEEGPTRHGAVGREDMEGRGPSAK